MRRSAIRVTGTVQGVGFRPFVYSLATRLGLSGHVGNDVQGVFIEVQGQRVEEFLHLLCEQAPPMAVVDEVTAVEVPPRSEQGFRIVESHAAGDGAVTSIPPDTAICDECLKEMRDPADRRFGYPFIACTNCGPRYTMVTGLPYDRDNTSMADFPLCDLCLAEYTDPASRRYHAQPVACWDCGPRLSMPVPDVVDALRAGRIVAIKGIGGYHLACDAGNDQAVASLRQRKRRGDKPFAVMAADVGHAEGFAELDAASLGLLRSPARPILLAPSTDPQLQRRVAPGNTSIGVMLAYTPLHHLLYDTGAPPVLVMTSGNLADEPICTDAEEAELRLAGIADVFCHHDRVIQVACDDSVTRVVGGRAQPVRRSRGYAPSPLPLPVDCPPLLAVGGEIKATAAVAAGRRAWLTQHIGDVENLETLEMLRRCLTVLSDLQQISPEMVVSDRHPGYLSRRWAAEHAAGLGVEHVTVQHHHAHLASLLAEHRVPADEPVLGVVFDGTGYGEDGTIWGGELLLGSYAHVTRVGHLRPVALPGGDAAIRFPARTALAHLHAAGLEAEGTAAAAAMTGAELGLLQQMLAGGSHCTPTTSVGRLFDAVASLLDVRHAVDYEAQAAIELEALAVGDPSAWPAQVDDVDGQVVIDPRGWVGQAVAAHRAGVPVPVAARAFHAGLADAVAEAAVRLRDRHGVDTVGLSGGVFANAVLSLDCEKRLKNAGFAVLVHTAVPPNDGGLALGQVCVAAVTRSSRVG